MFIIHTSSAQQDALVHNRIYVGIKSGHNWVGSHYTEKGYSYNNLYKEPAYEIFGSAFEVNINVTARWHFDKSGKYALNATWFRRFYKLDRYFVYNPLEFPEYLGYSVLMNDFALLLEYHHEIANSGRVSLNSFFAAGPSLISIFHPRSTGSSEIPEGGSYVIQGDVLSKRTPVLKVGTGLLLGYYGYRRHKYHLVGLELYYTQGFVRSFTQTIHTHNDNPNPTVIATRGGGVDVYLSYYISVNEFFKRNPDKPKKRRRKVIDQSIQWYE